MLSADQLAAILWRRKVTFVLTFLVVLGAAAAVTFSLPKVYRTGAYIYVTSGQQSASDFEQVQTNQVVTRTISELLQTRAVADAVALRLPFPATGRELRQSVDVAPIEQSQLITVTAEGSTPRRAQQIANVYAGTAIGRIAEIVGEPGAARATLAASAPLVTSQARPRPKLYLLVGGIIALFAATAAAVLRHRMDQRLELDESSTELQGIPILGRVATAPSDELEAWVRFGESSRSTQALAEQYRLLLANLAFANHGRRPATLAVVSAGQSEGKSTTVFALGRAAMELGVRTLLVDADLRRPRLTRMAGLGGEGAGPGLSTFLLDAEPLALSDIAVDLDGGGLTVVPSGPVPPNPSALLSSQALNEFEARARKVFDLVIFDTPPMTIAADASLLAARTEGVVLVVDAGRTRRTPLLRSVDQLERAKATMLGMVVNRAAGSAPASYYYGSRPQDGRRERRRRRSAERPAVGGSVEG